VSSLQQPFRSLVASKMISPLPRSEDRFRFHVRNPSVGWTFARELAATLTNPATTNRRPSSKRKVSGAARR
jgi:hypothetical protein